MSHKVLQKFEANGIDYEIKGWVTGNDNDGSFFIRVFKAGTNTPANGYEYSVKIQDQMDAAIMRSSLDPFKSLVETAEKDVRNGTWESYLKALKELEADGK